MPTPSPRLAIAAALAATALALTGCAADAPKAAPAATVETATVETATVETATPIAELPFPEQVEQSWLLGRGITDFAQLEQPESGPPNFAAYVTDVRSDAPGEATATLSLPEPADPAELQRFVDREFQLIQNVGEVDLQKLTVTTADGTSSAVSGGAAE